ncbi:MAG: ATP-dependent DNA helicase RecG [Flavobacteriales bacterium]
MKGPDTAIEYLKGVGPERAKLLQEELGIRRFEDLLYHIPFRYLDRSVFHRVRDLSKEQGQVQLKGILKGLEKVGKPGKQRLVAKLEDESGSIELVWFKGGDRIRKGLHSGKEYVAFGRPNRYKGSFNIPHPEMTLWEDFQKKEGASLEPVYSSTEKLTGKGLHSRGINKLTAQLLEELKGRIPELLPRELLERYGLPDRERAFRIVHFPSDGKSLELAKRRLKFEELFFLQLRIHQKRFHQQKDLKGHPFEKVGDRFHRFYEEGLPFELTGAQKRVLKEIRKDMGSGLQMNRLLQGDVGSGKTLVALLTMLIAKDNGFQSAMMAPTETLAQQHFRTLSELLVGTEVNVALLTGSTPQSERRVLHESLEEGDIDILVGTHALIEDKVRFRSLGVVVIDEQHRFGVAQRARLWKKGQKVPHVLVMTATPIPRTLAMTLYGDLDVSVIDELPPGRKPIKTVHRTESSRLSVFGSLKELLRKGGQLYIVYPLVESSEKVDYKNLMEGYEAVQSFFPPPEHQVSIVHGRMSSEAKDHEMDRFKRGETDIMVATTVIEVGVDVSNASAMLIESVERFGLSQLHQLRGRVGRGSDQAYCILMSGEELSDDAKERIRVMTETNDGFRIAEKDMELRGPGDMSGTQQSGLVELKCADIVADRKIMEKAREEAGKILYADPDLSAPAFKPVREELQRIAEREKDWSLVS